VQSIINFNHLAVSFSAFYTAEKKRKRIIFRSFLHIINHLAASRVRTVFIEEITHGN